MVVEVFHGQCHATDLLLSRAGKAMVLVTQYARAPPPCWEAPEVAELDGVNPSRHIQLSLGTHGDWFHLPRPPTKYQHSICIDRTHSLLYTLNHLLMTYDT